MDDKQLLERAARAAGIEASPGAMTGKLVIHGTSRIWNPLEDDADAFRLMVQLKLDVEWCASGRVSAYRHANANGHCFTAIESSREDRSAATRRAIVRAAAAILGEP